MKEIEKPISCVYRVIMHLGNVVRILEKRIKHSATPCVFTGFVRIYQYIYEHIRIN
jgi:hypothetical protein